MISIASMHIDSYNCLELTQRLVILYPALVLYGIGITYITVHSIPSNTIQSKHLKCCWGPAWKRLFTWIKIFRQVVIVNFTEAQLPSDVVRL